MRIVIISDTHNDHDKIAVPPGDLLIHAGDATVQGSVSETGAFAEWFRSQPHEHKIFVAGNHDFLFERSRSLAVSMLGAVTYLECRMVEAAALKIYGSPYQPEYKSWAFGYTRGGVQCRSICNSIPEGLDILITHGPPHGILDARPDGLSIGCHDLLARVKQIKPKLHVFGHLHHGYGQIDLYGTRFVNAAMLDEAYCPGREPIVIDWPLENSNV